MRLVIAGWHGQLARALTDATLSAPDIAAAAVGRPALDVRDPRSIERAFSDITPDLVINTAAYTAVDSAEAEPDKAFVLNRDGARQFATAAARRGVPIIHLSTHYVFDGTKAAPYVETDIAAPETVYGRSKLEGEEAVREANPRHVILRTGWVFSSSSPNFCTRVCEQAKLGQAPLQMVVDQRINPTFAPDLAEIILAVARKLVGQDADRPIWGTYHAAGTGAATWYDVACEIVGQLEMDGMPAVPVTPIPSGAYPTKAKRPANGALDCSKLEQTFRLRLPPWQDAIARCVSHTSTS
jgi:dTDP-4-dehydrorhamnose reductase